jgi:hypothetical protein
VEEGDQISILVGSGNVSTPTLGISVVYGGGGVGHSTTGIVYGAG